ncbi:hypothetical protein TrVE_jg11159 [Triparma verrucosa]|uniref:O-GlcNAc transferase C-terminal domain-containing protein n=1 Tax=Triparma verrucosa TaxID=1606542 RepID=A0A9W7CK51_9STRA|nr:hypothetical protein TrVE_jg11159 [Triparma verrucosa]
MASLFDPQPHTLKLSSFSFHFGLGTSSGIPPSCHPNRVALFEEDEFVSMVQDLAVNFVELPPHIYNLFGLPPNGLSSKKRSAVKHPNPEVKARYLYSLSGSTLTQLSLTLQRVQCVLTTSTLSSPSVSESQITNAGVYKGLTLLSCLSSLVGQIDYSRLVLNDSYKILKYASGDVSPAVSHYEAEMYTLAHLGEMAAFQNDLEAALTFYQFAADIDPDNTPLNLLDGISGILLATGKIDLFVLSAREAQRRMLENLKSLTANLNEVSTTFWVGDKFWPELGSSSGDDLCEEMVNLYLEKMVSVPNLPPTSRSLELHGMAHQCLNGTLEISNGGQLPSDLHFRLGRNLQKRGYTEEARHHLRESSSPFIKNADMHEVYTRLALPHVYDSFKSQALMQSKFTYELKQLAENAQRTKNCEVIKNNFDALPLIRFADDGVTEEISLPGGGLLELGGAKDLYSYVSQMFFNVCPELRTAKINALDNKNDPAKMTRSPRKVRIGVVSAKLHNHETLKNHGQLIEHLASAPEIQLFVASYPTMKDHATSRIMREIQGTTTVINLQTSNSVERLLDASLDVILYLDLPVDARTYGLAHQRLAPVQAAMYGHHTYSSGIEDVVDYMIIPEDCVMGEANPTQTTSQYSEQAVMIEGFFLTPESPLYGDGENGTVGDPDLSPFADRATLLKTFMIPSNANIYIVPASVPHLSPSFDSAVKEILRADADAFVIFGVRELSLGSEGLQPFHWHAKDDLMQHSFPPVWVEKLKLRMKKKIAGGKRGGGLWRRVRFLSSSLLSDDYVAVLKGADVILDTFPFGNFLPSVTGLMLGTPVVTLSSEQRKASGRLTKAFYTHANMTRCCSANSLDEYVELAVGLANDNKFREEVVGEIRKGVEGGGGYYDGVTEFLISVGKSSRE